MLFERQLNLNKIRGELILRIFDAMVFKREIGTGCSVDVKIIDTLNDGLILSITENSVNENILEFITDFVNQHKLNLLLDNERYFISTKTLIPSDPYS